MDFTCYSLRLHLEAGRLVHYAFSPFVYAPFPAVTILDAALWRVAVLTDTVAALPSKCACSLL